MIILNKEEIQKCLPMKEAIEVCKKSLKDYSENKTNIPLRINLPVEKYNGQALFMPGSISSNEEKVGIKIVSVYPNNAQYNLPSVPSTVLMIDSKTGIVNGLLDGTYLTALRTAALQGAATDLLARKDSKIATLIGTGGQAFEQARALLTVRDLEELRVVGRNFEKTKRFVEKLKNELSEFPTNISAYEHANAAVIDSDIITTVTTSTTPTFDAKYVKDGTHINGIGSFTPDMIELPTELINKNNKTSSVIIPDKM